MNTIGNTLDLADLPDDGDTCTIGGNCGHPAIAQVIGWTTVGDTPKRDIRTTRSVCDQPTCQQIARMQVRRAELVAIVHE